MFFGVCGQTGVKIAFFGKSSAVSVDFIGVPVSGYSAYESKGRGFESRRAHQVRSVEKQRFFLFAQNIKQPGSGLLVTILGTRGHYWASFRACSRAEEMAAVALEFASAKACV